MEYLYSCSTSLQIDNIPLEVYFRSNPRVDISGSIKKCLNFAIDETTTSVNFTNTLNIMLTILNIIVNILNIILTIYSVIMIILITVMISISSRCKPLKIDPY